jgi:hypothetical protein
LQVPSGASLTITAASTGSLTATGGYYAAGIGGGQNHTGGIIAISGGTVEATGGDYGAGIGSGGYSAGGDITISGGMVTAARGVSSNKSDIGPGYDGADGTVTITGGSVYCESAGNEILPQPTNGIGDNVYLNTLTVGSPAITNAAITAGSIGGVSCNAVPNAAGGVYGIKDVKTDAAGIVYFYLPEAAAGQKVALTASGNTYAATYARSTSGLAQTLVLVAGNNGRNSGGDDWSSPVVTLPLPIQPPKTGEGAGAAWLLCMAGSIAVAFVVFNKKRQSAK